MRGASSLAWLCFAFAAELCDARSARVGGGRRRGGGRWGLMVAFFARGCSCYSLIAFFLGSGLVFVPFVLSFPKF